MILMDADTKTFKFYYELILQKTYLILFVADIRRIVQAFYF